jgi:hypothetical protein
VLLHVSILMTIGYFDHDPILLLLRARASKFGFNFAKPAHTILSECHVAIASGFAGDPPELGRF